MMMENHDQDLGLSLSLGFSDNHNLIPMKPDLTNDDDHGTISEEEDYINRKKLRLSKDQSSFLEQSFKQNNTLNPRQKLGIAKHLKLRPRQVEVWFQNRRARTKFKQTEIDCSILKRCWESLTEENQRLKIEVEDLRALKYLTNGLYMEMIPPPPIILNLCTSCRSPPAVKLWGRS